jgi:hypothetical protein
VLNTIETSSAKRKETNDRMINLEFEEKSALKEQHAFSLISVLFISLPHLRKLSPFYQFSLDFIPPATERTMNESSERQNRLANLVNQLTLSLFVAILRSGIEQYRIILAFIFVAGLLKAQKIITEGDETIFICGL